MKSSSLVRTPAALWLVGLCCFAACIHRVLAIGSLNGLTHNSGPQGGQVNVPAVASVPGLPLGCAYISYHGEDIAALSGRREFLVVPGAGFFMNGVYALDRDVIGDAVGVPNKGMWRIDLPDQPGRFSGGSVVWRSPGALLDENSSVAGILQSIRYETSADEGVLSVETTHIIDPISLLCPLVGFMVSVVSVVPSDGYGNEIRCLQVILPLGVGDRERLRTSGAHPGFLWGNVGWALVASLTAEVDRQTAEGLPLVLRSKEVPWRSFRSNGTATIATYQGCLVGPWLLNTAAGQSLGFGALAGNIYRVSPNVEVPRQVSLAGRFLGRPVSPRVQFGDPGLLLQVILHAAEQQFFRVALFVRGSTEARMTIKSAPAWPAALQDPATKFISLSFELKPGEQLLEMRRG